MNIVIAPDGFKDCLSAGAVGRHLATGLRRSLPDAKLSIVPMADGGEGTLEAVLTAGNGRRINANVCGPLGAQVSASYGVLPDNQVIIEMAAASGLELVPSAQRNPLNTTSYGTGELIAAALRAGGERFLIALGGSATIDGGTGMAQALGYEFFDRNGRALAPGMRGRDLAAVDSIRCEPSLREKFRSLSVQVACDVANPLLGEEGAARVYGAQKGANPEQVEQLESYLARLADIVQRDLGIETRTLESGGAAGGLGAGLVAFLGGQLRHGAEVVIEAVQLERMLQSAQLVISGEGRIDAQTAFGKAPYAVAALGSRLGIPVILVGGSLGPDANELFSDGVAALESVVAADMSLEEALENAPTLLEAAGERIGRWLQLSVSRF